MAAWRGGRALTWITGMVLFLCSIVTALTGYVSQSNFDSQWISTQAKDAINGSGGGAFFNLLNGGQMLMWHIVLMPVSYTHLDVYKRQRLVAASSSACDGFLSRRASPT